MANYMDQYAVMTDEIFAEYIKTDKGIHEVRHAHGVSDGRGHSLGKIAFVPRSMATNYRMQVTDAQIEAAKVEYDRRHTEELAIAQEVGTLTFVTMGMDYESNIIGGLGNHRIRATFEDKKGHKWFVEVHPSNQPRTKKGDPDDTQTFYGSWTDVTFEEEEQARFERETEALIAKYGSEKNVPHYAWHSERKWPEQRHGYIGDMYAKCTINDQPVGYKPTTGRQFTANDLRVWINQTFKCNYKKFHLNRRFLSPDDYVSKCM